MILRLFLLTAAAVPRVSHGIFWSRSSANSDKAPVVDDYVPPFAGVGKADAAEYRAAIEAGSLLCGSDKRVVIAKINDDFCDCPEGPSDEPGTSACPGGRFYCVNSGHRGGYIASSRVRDGVCDCCDGSDEAPVAAGATTAAAAAAAAAAGGGSICRNTCAETHAAWSRQHADVMKELEAGARAKAKYASEGQAAAAARAGRIEAAKLEVEKAGHELAAAKEVEKAAIAAESEQKAAILVAAEGTVKGALGSLELTAVALGNLAVDVATHKEAAMSLLPGILEDLKGDSDVDAAIRAFESKLPGGAVEKAAAKEAAAAAAAEKKGGAEAGAEEEAKEGSSEGEAEDMEFDGYPEDEEPYDHLEDYDAEAYGDDDAGYRAARKESGGAEEGGESGEKTAEESKDGEASGEEGDSAAVPPPAPKPKNFKFKSDAAEAARTRVKDLDRAEKSARQNLDALVEEDLLDYGELQQFQPLKGQCFSLKVGQYTYEMCPYGEARQKEGGGSGTFLGRWKRIALAGEGAAAAAAAQAGELEPAPRLETALSFSFEDGTRCWNGPQRSLFVRLFCGGADKVLSVEEPETCKYVMQFATPAACDGARPGDPKPRPDVPAAANDDISEKYDDDDDYGAHDEF